MNKYKCDICSKNHTVFYGIKGHLPEDIKLLIENDDKRILEYQGMYLLDKSNVLLKGTLQFQTEFIEPFTYYTWISLPAKEFVEKSESFKNEMAIKGDLLCNLIPFYNKTKGIKIEATFRSSDKNHESAEIKVIEESKLKTDQETIFSKEKFIKFMNKLHHWKKK